MALGRSKSLHTLHVDFGDRQPCNQISVSTLGSVTSGLGAPVFLSVQWDSRTYLGSGIHTETPGPRTMDRGRALGLWDPGWGSRGVGQGGGDGKCATPRSLPLDGGARVGKGGAPGTCHPLLEPVEVTHPAHRHAPGTGRGRDLGSGKEETTEREGGVHTCRSGWRRGHAALLPRKAWLLGNELEMALQGHPSHRCLLPTCQSCRPVLPALGMLSVPISCLGPRWLHRGWHMSPWGQGGRGEEVTGKWEVIGRGQVRDCHRASWMETRTSFNWGLRSALAPAPCGRREGCAQEGPGSSDSLESVGH